MFLFPLEAGGFTLLPTVLGLFYFPKFSFLNSSYISGPPVKPISFYLSSLLGLLSFTAATLFSKGLLVCLFLFLAKSGSISRFNFSRASIFLIVNDTTDRPT